MINQGDFENIVVTSDRSRERIETEMAGAYSQPYWRRWDNHQYWEHRKRRAIWPGLLRHYSWKLWEALPLIDLPRNH